MKTSSAEPCAGYRYLSATGYVRERHYTTITRVFDSNILQSFTISKTQFSLMFGLHSYFLSKNLERLSEFCCGSRPIRMLGNRENRRSPGYSSHRTSMEVDRLKLSC